MNEDQRSLVMGMLEILTFSAFAKWSHGYDVSSDKLEKMEDRYRQGFETRNENYAGTALFENIEGNIVPGSMIYKASLMASGIVGKSEDPNTLERVNASLFSTLSHLDEDGVFLARARKIAELSGG